MAPPCHALLVEDGAFCHEIEYVTIFLEILNPEGHQHCITGSKVTAILLNWWILRVGGVASGRVCAHCVKQACFLLNRQFSLCHGIGLRETKGGSTSTRLLLATYK